MKLSEIILTVRDLVNDPSSKYWSDVEITRWVNQHVRALFRQRVNADPSYGMHRLDISGSDAEAFEQVNARRFAYFFPSWVYKIRMVRETKGIGEEQGGLIPPLGYARPGFGWHFAGNRHIEIYGYDRAPDITLDVAKVPALLHQGVASKTSAYTAIYLDYPERVGFDYPFETEEGAYDGALIEITSGADATRDPRKSVATVRSTSSVWDSGTSSWLTHCDSVRPIFSGTVQAGDSYELHAEIDNAHMNYLCLLVAQSLFQRTNNVEGIMGIQASLGLERAEFIDGIQPRQDYYPQFVQNPNYFSGPQIQDRDPMFKPF